MSSVNNVSNQNGATIFCVIMLLFLVVGIFLIISGVRKFRLMKDEEKCIRLSGVIIDNRELSSCKNGRTSISYAPIIEYYYNNTRQEYTSNHYYSKQKPVGTKMDIYLNKEKDEVFEASEGKNQIVTGCCFTISMLIFLIIFIYFK